MLPTSAMRRPSLIMLLQKGDSSSRTISVPWQGEPLKATAIRKRIDSVRSFFCCLQKYSYEVNGRLEPRLEINWNPADALAFPTYVRAQLKPNQSDIDEVA